MKIQTFKVDKYKGKPIYYRNFNRTFEYLTIIKGELYTAHLDIRPNRILGLLYKLGIKKNQYTEDQNKNILKELNLMARTTIDFVNKVK